MANSHATMQIMTRYSIIFFSADGDLVPTLASCGVPELQRRALIGVKPGGLGLMETKNKLWRFALPSFDSLHPSHSRYHPSFGEITLSLLLLFVLL